MENVESVYPLTGMQQGMLLRVLRRPGSGEYVEQVSWTLEGALDDAAFARAWRLVMDRHPVLRTAFLWEGLEQPLQVVRSGRALPTAEHDWRGVPAGERAERLAGWLAEDRARGFDLAAAPLMRLTALRLSGAETHWVWTYHHLLLDGWSASLCLRDVFAAYDALRRGEAPALPPAVPFERYVAWTGAQDAAAGEAFWRDALAGFEGADAPGVLRPGAREGERYGVASAALEP
ncbi:MAG TPA: condensation domain-containing protein, partial [Longimicrobiaceae bacterium]|nr:condensation domain-containing protein [Longimicrobiaceae bacterium]